MDTPDELLSNEEIAARDHAAYLRRSRAAMRAAVKAERVGVVARLDRKKSDLAAHRAVDATGWTATDRLDHDLATARMTADVNESIERVAHIDDQLRTMPKD